MLEGDDGKGQELLESFCLFLFFCLCGHDRVEVGRCWEVMGMHLHGHDPNDYSKSISQYFFAPSALN